MEIINFVSTLVLNTGGGRDQLYIEGKKNYQVLFAMNVKSCKKFSAKLGVETKLVNSFVNSFLEKVTFNWVPYQKLLTILHTF